MAISYDATTVSAADYTSIGTQTTSHVGSASTRAAVVLVSQAGTADSISSVTYGGVTMNRVAFDVDATSGDAGAVYIYWLVDPPTGTQNVSMVSTTTDAKRLSVSTMLCASTKQVGIAGEVTSTTTAANPSVAITGLTSGNAHAAYFTLFSGLNTMTTTPGSGWTNIVNADRGTDGYGQARLTTITSGVTSITATWTAATSDNYVISAIAFTETAVTRLGDALDVTTAPTTISAGLAIKTAAALDTAAVADTGLASTTLTKTATATDITQSPGVLADSAITSPGVAQYRDISGNDKTYGTSTGQIGYAGPKLSQGSTSLTTAPTTASSGFVTDTGDAGVVSVNPTTASALGAVTKSINATGITQVPTVDSALGIVAKTGSVSVTTAPATVSAGTITDDASAAITTALTTTAALGTVSKTGTADATTTSLTTAVTPANLAKSTDTSLTTTPTTASALGANIKSASATGLNPSPSTAADGNAWRQRFFKPDALLVQTGLSGTVASIQDSPTSPDGSWLTPTGGAVNLRMSFEDPRYTLRANAGDQIIRVLIKAAP